MAAGERVSEAMKIEIPVELGVLKVLESRLSTRSCGACTSFSRWGKARDDKLCGLSSSFAVLRNLHTI